MGLSICTYESRCVLEDAALSRGAGLLFFPLTVFDMIGDGNYGLGDHNGDGDGTGVINAVDSVEWVLTVTEGHGSGIFLVDGHGNVDGVAEDDGMALAT